MGIWFYLDLSLAFWMAELLTRLSKSSDSVQICFNFESENNGISSKDPSSIYVSLYKAGLVNISSCNIRKQDKSILYASYSKVNIEGAGFGS